MLDLTWDIVVMGTSVFIIGYALHLMACYYGWEASNDEADDLDVESDLDIQQYDAEIDSSSYRKGHGNTVLDKWMSFGGGYYGTVAFVELIFIELDQFKNFVSNFPGVPEFIDSLGIDFLIAFFIDQIMNFVAAIIWPTNYLGKHSIFEVALFVGATWLIYEQARKRALMRAKSE